MKLFSVHDNIVIRAPIERCFLLSTSVALVQKTLGMKPVAGRTSGHVVDGDTVRWEGWQLGFPNYHVSLITEFEEPYHFQDRMIAGRFRGFEHDHRFEVVDGGVLLSDEVRFTMPFGVLGQLVGTFMLVPHVRRLVRARFAMLKQLAESDAWRLYVETT